MKAKLEKNAEFRQRMSQREEKYRVTLQRAYYSNLSVIDSDIIKQAGIDVAGRPVYVFYGDLQPKQDKLLDKLYLFIVKWLEDEFGKHPRMLDGDPARSGFTLVYFNTFCESSSHYEDFRGMLRTFPPRVILGMNYLIVVHPTLRVKTLDWIVIGTVNNELKDRTHYVDTIQKCEKYGVQVDETFLKRLREEIREHDFPDQKDKKTKPQPAVHKKEDLEKILEKQETKKKLQDYEISEIGVPSLLKTLVLYMKMNPDFLVQEGIFRRSVSIDEEREAAAHLHSQDYEYLQSISNAYLVAMLIKRFLTSLAEPLFPFDTYRKLAMINCEDPGCVSTVREIVKTLPLLNFTTLMFLLKFFVEEIIPRHEQNKMTSYNSAVVLLPCLLWSEMRTLDDLTLGKNLAKVLEQILVNFQYIFGDEKEQNKKYRESSRKSRKKFENKLFEQQEGEEDDRPKSKRTSERGSDKKGTQSKGEVPKERLSENHPTLPFKLQNSPPQLVVSIPINQPKEAQRQQGEQQRHVVVVGQPLDIGFESQPHSIMQSKAHPHRAS